MKQTRELIPGFGALLHGGDYNPDQWLGQPEVIDEDFRLFEASGCNTFSVGIFAWARLEPADGVYEFEWLDGILDRLAAAGKNVILATPSGARPFWLAQAYPEVLRVDRTGKRETPVLRHNQCWSSPVYRAKTREMNTRLAQRYGRHPAVKLWHVSNELSGECYCERCIGGFQDWLKARYGTLEKLNAAWWADFWAHRHTAWEQVNPRDFTLDGLGLDWRRYTSWQAVEFYQAEAKTLREFAPGVPVLTNLMGLFEWIDYHALAEHLDIVADDSYPGYDAEDAGIETMAAETGFKFDLLRCLKGEPRAWFLMESCIDGNSVWKPLKLKPPGLHHLEMFQALAHGADGTLYFQWRKGRGGVEKYHGGVVHHSHPEETRSFKEVSALSRRYERAKAVIGSLNRAEVAVLFGWESRWAYRAARGLPQNNGDMLVKHAVAQYRAFWKRGMTVDVLAERHAFSGYRLVVVPRAYLIAPGLAERLRAYVEGGGWVVITALTGMVTETNLCWTDGCPGDGLGALAGVWMEEVGERPAAAPWRVSAVEGNALGLGGKFEVPGIFSHTHLRGATALLSYADGWLEGAPVLTVNAVGAGRVYYLAADLDAKGTDRVYAAIAKARGLNGVCAGNEALPAGVTWQMRVADDGRQFGFALNFSAEARSVRLENGGWRDLETGEAVQNGAMELAAWEAKVLTRSEA